jgi:hypothetical protein
MNFSCSHKCYNLLPAHLIPLDRNNYPNSIRLEVQYLIKCKL